MCEYSDAIKLPKYYPPSCNFWLAKEVKKEVTATVLTKTIEYYENTKYSLKKGKKKSAQLSCV